MRLQFTLQTLLLSAVVIWSSMAVFGPGGLVLAAVILAAVAYIRSSRSMWHAAGVVFLIFLCGGWLLLLLPAVESAREQARASTCTGSLYQIALAMRGYHDAHGCFPPAYIADSNGKPTHSWRVLLLPYLDGQVLYQAYNFGEPWDGPNNRKLAQDKPSTYACASSRNWTSGSPMTDYVAVAGPRTLWAKDKTIRLQNTSDGASNTIMLVEIANSDINWMEPRDLSFEEVVHGSGFSSHHARSNGYFYHDTPVVNVALADGRVQTLPQGLPSEMLEALLTIDGGEAVDIEECANHAIPPRLNWTHCCAVVALLASVLLLLLRPRRRELQGPQLSDGAPGNPGRQTVVGEF